MMDKKKTPSVTPQETIEELNDAQLSQVSGGITIPTLPSTGRPSGVKLGQALDKPSVFTKSDDQSPAGSDS